MLDYMLTIARKAAELTKDKFSDVFAALDDLVFDQGICNDVFERLGMMKKFRK